MVLYNTNFCKEQVPTAPRSSVTYITLLNQAILNVTLRKQVSVLEWVTLVEN